MEVLVHSAQGTVHTNVWASAIRLVTGMDRRDIRLSGYLLAWTAGTLQHSRQEKDMMSHCHVRLMWRMILAQEAHLCSIRDGFDYKAQIFGICDS